MRKFLLTLAGAAVFFAPQLNAFTTATGDSEMFFGLRGNGFVSDLGSYFDSQFDVADFLFIRSAMSVKAADAIFAGAGGMTGNEGIAGRGLLFTCDELSASVHLPMMGPSSYASLFMANSYESIGTDSFLGKYFGTPPVSSQLLQNRIRRGGVPIYHTSGLGFALHSKFDAPLTAGLEVVIPSDTSMETANFGVRLGGSFESSNLDFGLGAAALTAGGIGHLHFGLSWFVSGRDGGGFLLQLGFKDYMPSYSLDNLYFVAEPRLAFGPLHLAITLFALPDETDLYDDIIFVDFANTYQDSLGKKLGAMGLGFQLYNENVAIGPVSGKLSIALVVGLDTDLGTMIDPQTADPGSPGYSISDHLHAQITPGISIPLRNGVVFGFVTIDPLAKNPKVEVDPAAAGDLVYSTAPDILGTLKIRIGYLAQF